MLYQAPERLIDGDGGKRADCWSLGVIFYTLLFARYPFHHSNLEILKSQILAAAFQMSQSKLSAELRPLLSRLLCRCPEERLSTGEILDWLSGLQSDQRGELPEIDARMRLARGESKPDSMIANFSRPTSKDLIHVYLVSFRGKCPESASRLDN